MGFERLSHAARDVPELCEFPSLDRSQQGFLWTHKVVDLVPHPIVGFVLQVGDAEKFHLALGLESPDPFLQSQQAGSPVARDLYSLNLLVKLMLLPRQILFNLAITAIT